jgi:hypothetical protein
VVVKAFKVRRCHQFQKVLVACPVLGEQGHVKGEALRRVSFAPRTVGNVAFHADYWLYPNFFGRLVKLDRAVEVAVVGQGNGWLPEFFRPIDHIAQSAETIEQGIL